MQSSDPSSSPVSTLTCYDYNRRYCGHCNTTTDIKEANFFGSAGNYIVAGSDGGPYLNDDYMGRGRGYKNADVVRVVDFAEDSRFFFILVVSQQKIVSLSII